MPARDFMVINLDAGGCAMDNRCGRVCMAKAEANEMARDARRDGYRVRVIDTTKEPELSRNALHRNANSRRVLLMNPSNPARAALLEEMRRNDEAFAGGR